MDRSAPHSLETLDEAQTRGKAQELLDQSVSLFSAAASRAIQVGGRRDHPLVQAAEVELNRVKPIATRLGENTVPMSVFVDLVTQINAATERLTKDMQ